MSCTGIVVDVGVVVVVGCYMCGSRCKRWCACTIALDFVSVPVVFARILDSAHFTRVSHRAMNFLVASTG